MAEQEFKVRTECAKTGCKNLVKLGTMICRECVQGNELRAAQRECDISYQKGEESIPNLF